MINHVVTVKGTDKTSQPQDIPVLEFPEYPERLLKLDPDGLRRHQRMVQDSLNKFRESLIDYLQRKDL
jgi:hypothetical protein